MLKKIKNMKSKVNELAEHVSKIENGTISLPELEFSVELAREIYERLIVIRHKVYEESILEKPAFDLSPIEFDEEETTENSSIEEVNAQATTETETSHEELEEELPVENEEIQEEVVFELDEPQEEIFVQETAATEESIEEIIITPSNTIMDFSDDLEQAQPEIPTHNAPVSGNPASADLISKIKEIEASIPASITLSKLDTLIGSFGLNERLQFINELFGGSSESFSDAVKVLDARTGMDSARDKILEFANENNWLDADPETVSDFIAKIKRRYA